MQTLVDFVAKMTPVVKFSEPSVEKWQVWADGACNIRDVGIGVVLQGP